MTGVRIWATTHTGLVRHRNEDAYGATSLAATRQDAVVSHCEVLAGPVVAVVADGLGGHADGHRASALAVQSILDAKPDTAESLVTAVHVANELIVAEMSQRPESAGMGTTIATVLIADDIFTVVNVGDSSAFEFIDDQLVQLSIDDVPPGTSDLPGMPTSIVTQTLGGHRNLQKIVPHLYQSRIDRNSRLLLCTDGLTNYVPKTMIADVLRTLRDDSAVTELLQRALDAGAPDNVTVMIVEVEPHR